MGNASAGRIAEELIVTNPSLTSGVIPYFIRPDDSHE